MAFHSLVALYLRHLVYLLAHTDLDESCYSKSGIPRFLEQRDSLYRSLLPGVLYLQWFATSVAAQESWQAEDTPAPSRILAHNLHRARAGILDRTAHPARSGGQVAPALGHKVAAEVNSPAPFAAAREAEVSTLDHHIA